MNVKFVDGLVEQLKGQTPLQEMDSNPVYTLMQQKELGNFKFAQIVRDMHEHRPFTEDRLGALKQEPEKDIRVMTSVSGDNAAFAVVKRQPEADGSYAMLARVNISKVAPGKWELQDFFTSLDPTGMEKDEAKRYVDLAAGIRKEYKGNSDKFVADFLQGLQKGDDVWGAMTTADHAGKIDKIFDGARREEQQRIDAGEKPMALRKITDDRIGGTFTGHTSPDENAPKRTSVAPTLRHKS